jgi:hypothetical protein
MILWTRERVRMRRQTVIQNKETYIDAKGVRVQVAMQHLDI